MDKKTVAVMFGGRSAEHEISIITALQAISALDTLRYNVVPVYLHPNGKWYTGENFLDKGFYRNMNEALRSIQQVMLLPDPSLNGLLKISHHGKADLNQIIPIDVYFLSFHGQYGEDGCLQGVLEMADAAYTGCGVLASAIAMDKYPCKLFLQAHGIPVLPSVVVSRKSVVKDLADVRRQILSTSGLEKFPLFVKPAHLGSSIGIGIATDENTLNAALAKVFRYDDKAIIEPCVTQLMEINISVLEGNPPRASVVEVPVASGQALTYEDKYLRGGGKKTGRGSGMASLSRVIDPKDLDESIKKDVTKYALKAYELLGCYGVGRFDFIYDKGSGQLYFNELNPLPGSLSFYLWQKSIPPLFYTQVLDCLIQGAMQRKVERQSLQRDIGFKALRE